MLMCSSLSPNVQATTFLKKIQLLFSKFIKHKICREGDGLGRKLQRGETKKMTNKYTHSGHDCWNQMIQVQTALQTKLAHFETVYQCNVFILINQ